ncbi:hypothetical protein FANTH_8711 [Fusarium anthophilum]|uniref:Uncharacterized protein n=1 Tax=Fusarium anthophilum TaxID=48485 RepID=A0A8H4Z8J1_9HYPO|nr:hypothetical protein FANTH_8711 [Fusarium anthophilum]
MALVQYPAALTPHLIGIFPAYITNRTETLIVREKTMSLTGDDFEVYHINGQPLLTVEGKVMSVSGRKIVNDMRGTHLFSIVKEHCHVHTTYAVEDPQGTKLVNVRSNLRLFNSSATATFNSINGSAEILEMNGKWHDYSASIVDTLTDSVVACISRRVTGRDLILGQQTYILEVKPGVDMALMVAMCICFDEKNNER